MRTLQFSKNFYSSIKTVGATVLGGFYSSIKTVGATVLGGLRALEWAWHCTETNLRCAGSSIKTVGATVLGGLWAASKL